MANGIVRAVRGVVLDVEFPVGSVPEIYEALTMDGPDGGRLTLEVQQHLGGGLVRTVAMSATEGLKRDQEVVATGAPITVPVGAPTLGRIFNVTGDPIDGQGEVASGGDRYPIHRSAPALAEQSTTAETFETGMKVIDLIAPFGRAHPSLTRGAGDGRGHELCRRP